MTGGQERRPRRGVAAAIARAFAPAEEIDAARERLDAERAGFDSIADIVPRTHVRLTGFLSSIVVHPESADPVVEVELYDGTGGITLLWMGRDRITGIEPGTRLAVSGLATVRHDHPIMYNPKYDILARPDEELR